MDQKTEQSILNLRKFKEKYRVVRPEVVKLMLQDKLPWCMQNIELMDYLKSETMEINAKLAMCV